MQIVASELLKACIDAAGGQLEWIQLETETGDAAKIERALTSLQGTLRKYEIELKRLKKEQRKEKLELNFNRKLERRRAKFLAAQAALAAQEAR